MLNNNHRRGHYPHAGTCPIYKAWSFAPLDNWKGTRWPTQNCSGWYTAAKSYIEPDKGEYKDLFKAIFSCTFPADNLSAKSHWAIFPPFLLPACPIRMGEGELSQRKEGGCAASALTWVHHGKGAEILVCQGETLNWLKWPSLFGSLQVGTRLPSAMLLADCWLHYAPLCRLFFCHWDCISWFVQASFP